MIRRRLLAINAARRNADEVKESRNFLLIVRKILVAGDLLAEEHIGLARDAFERREHARGQRHVIHRNGVSTIELDLRRAPGAFGNQLHGIAYACPDVSPHGFVEGSYRAEHFDCVGNDIVTDATANRADAQYGGLERNIHLAADDGLQTEYDLR